MGNFWQEESNSVWLTDTMPACSVCGKPCESAVELVGPEGAESVVCCFGGTLDGKGCLQDGLRGQFASSGEEYALARLIMFSGNKKGKRKREPIGLSKRYQVMKRDGFQCVLCGAGGDSARLEIDHKTPLAKGGKDSMDNLQTLCFNCNRGKRDAS